MGILYVFGIAFCQMTDDHPVHETYFPTVPESMNTLLFDGILTQSRVLVQEMTACSPALWPAMTLFIFLTAITTMYMLVGVMVDCIACIAAGEKEGVIASVVAERFRDAFQKAGRSDTNPITKYEFTQVLQEPEIAAIILEIGVDIVVLMDMIDVIYDDPTRNVVGLTFETFVEIVLNMRGTLPCSVKDTRELYRVLKKSSAENHEATSKSLIEEIRKLRDEVWELITAALREEKERRDGEDEFDDS